MRGLQLDRRSFIRSTALAGTGLVLNPLKVLSKQDGAANSLFCVHPFVQDNPEAVFIMRTDVDIKTNAQAMKEAGISFTNSVLGLTEDTNKGVPLTHKYVFKPNLTCRMRQSGKYTIERSMGIVTDSNFMEGIIESMQDFGIPGFRMYIREVIAPGTWKTEAIFPWQKEQE